MLKKLARLQPGSPRINGFTSGAGKDVIQRRHRSTFLQRATPFLPRFLQPSTWSTIIPSSIRSATKDLFAENKKKTTNPATFFIWIYILIGSQAIRIIQVKNDQATFARKADLQIEKLREVIRRLQAGEEVDVEKMLGTGVQEEEDAWEEALREIEKEELIWAESKQEKRARKRLEKEQQALEQKEKEDANPISSVSIEQGANGSRDGKQVAFVKPSFY